MESKSGEAEGLLEVVNLVDEDSPLRRTLRTGLE